MAIQKTGATIASEKFSARLSIAARATPAASSVVGVAADDVRHRVAAGGDAVRFERGGDVGDMAVQAALRDRACWRTSAAAKMPNGRRSNARLDDEREHADDGEQDQERQQRRRRAAPAALRLRD